MWPQLPGRAKRIALALNDEDGQADVRQVCDAELIGLAGRMQRIAKQHEA